MISGVHYIYICICSVVFLSLFSPLNWFFTVYTFIYLRIVYPPPESSYIIYTRGPTPPRECWYAALLDCVPRILLLLLYAFILLLLLLLLLLSLSSHGNNCCCTDEGTRKISNKPTGIWKRRKWENTHRTNWYIYITTPSLHAQRMGFNNEVLLVDSVVVRIYFVGVVLVFTWQQLLLHRRRNTKHMQ